jgi:hypothetical protein
MLGNITCMAAAKPLLLVLMVTNSSYHCCLQVCAGRLSAVHHMTYSPNGCVSP